MIILYQMTFAFKLIFEKEIYVHVYDKQHILAYLLVMYIHFKSMMIYLPGMRVDRYPVLSKWLAAPLY